MHPDWARSVRDQCLNAQVAFFFKQWGAYDEAGIRRGKKVSGRHLGGRIWDQQPPRTRGGAPALLNPAAAAPSPLLA
jgi:protein gp37